LSGSEVQEHGNQRPELSACHPVIPELWGDGDKGIVYGETVESGHAGTVEKEFVREGVVYK
jgi:hypothetical protein